MVTDGAEILAGFNPLFSDIEPLGHSIQGSTFMVGDLVSLIASGGSGTYTWTSSVPDILTINGMETALSLQTGSVILILSDAIFSDLPSKSVTLKIINSPIVLNQTGSLILQKKGYIDLRASGGSGDYDWTLSDETLADMTDVGEYKRITSLGVDGAFELTVSDRSGLDLSSVQVNITVGLVPGDVNGNSFVELDDAVLLLNGLTGHPDSSALHLNGDVDGDGVLDMGDVFLIFKALSIP